MLDKRYGNDGEFILEMTAEIEEDKSDGDTEAEHLDLALHPDDNIDDEDRTSTRKRRRSGSKVASSRCNYKSQYDDKWYESSRDRRRPEDQGRHAGEQSNKRRKAESHSSRSKDDQADPMYRCPQGAFLPFPSCGGPQTQHHSLHQPLAPTHPLQQRNSNYIFSYMKLLVMTKDGYIIYIDLPGQPKQLKPRVFVPLYLMCKIDN